MKQALGLVSMVVRDYDEALAFFVGKLGFALVEDTEIPQQSKRWVVVSPPGAGESRLLLARVVVAGTGVAHWRPDWRPGIFVPAHR